MANNKNKPVVTARDLSLIRVVGVIVIVVLFLYFGIVPAITQHQTLEDKNTELQAEVAKCSSAAPTIALQSQAETNYGIVKQMLTGYPTTLDSSQLDKLVTQIAESHGVTVYSFAINVKKDSASTATSSNGYAIAPVYTPSDGTSTSSSSSSKTSGTELTGIHSNSVTVVFVGDEDDLQSVVDTISSRVAYPYVNMTGFTWGETSVSTSASTAIDFVTVEMTVYSYEDNTGSVSTGA